MIKFELSVAFSLFNKVCVLEACEGLVRFGIVDSENEKIKAALSKAVERFFAVQNYEQKINCIFEKISEEELKRAVSFDYGRSEKKEVEDGIKAENASENGGETVQALSGPSENAAALLLDSLIIQACRAQATDIHIEDMQVRFRCFGALKNVCSLSEEKCRELIRRIKVLAKLNLMETRRGQDGQFVFDKDERIFVRVSCVPSLVWNEKAEEGLESVVMRLLDVSRVPLELDGLGFTPEQSECLRELSMLNSGLILICGATGSGKSTTASSLLMEIKERSLSGRKLISIEDPPEYLLKGVTQLKVNEACGMSFSEALRLVFRQDPDVIFVGEIRDRKTAETVIQAAMTGHFVVATLHAAGTGEARLRMQELGIDENELKAVLNGIIYQELKCSGEKAEMKAEIEIFEKEAEGVFC